MNILISNDDGYNAKGIKTLANELAKNHNVFIVAPSSNRSAVSHGLTLFETLQVEQIEKNIWAFSGKPADCVILGLRSGIIKDKIDVVISGINNGLNVGTDILFSGTCAAARQGSFYGYPSIAVSLETYGKDEKIDYSGIANFVNKNLEKLINLIESCKNTHFININAYSLEELKLKKYKGVRFSKLLTNKKYTDSFSYELINQTQAKSKFIFGQKMNDLEDFSDEYWCKEGYISISKVFSEPQQDKIEEKEEIFVI